VKVVITDHRFPDVEQERRAVESSGGTLFVGQIADEEQLAAVCRDADGVLTVRAPITKRVITAMEHCRDTIDIAAATQRGIMVANVPDYCIDEVSDHAMALLLMLSRQMIPAISLAKEKRWAIASMPPLHRLRGQVCGLVGCGKIGSLLVGKVSQLGMRVLIYDPYLSSARCRAMGAEPVSFDALLEGSDFISLHAPLNDATHHLFGAAAFTKMKRSASIINTARSGLIDEPALIAALDAEKIFGAGLDVVEAESELTPVGSALTDHPRVIVTPHTAWLSVEARSTLQARAIAQVLTCFKGDQPYGLINRELAK
jgi:D-3-phosphoglycerate dehydrogenase